MAEPRRCTRCGATLSREGGSCAGCLLRGALEGETLCSLDQPRTSSTNPAVPAGPVPPDGTAPAALAAPPPLSPAGGSLFAGYDLLEELGRGGMGIVYRALDRKRNRVVALKTLRSLNPAALQRFKREFRLLANLAHPNLVPLYELSSDGVEWCFTMEFVEGVELLASIRHGGASRGNSQAPLTTPAQWQRLRCGLMQLGLGIQALHEAGRLHRDVKPNNALVTREGRVVLLDFGLAADLGKEDLYQSTEQHVLGTVAYMSPEQASAQPVSTATDWYSVGVILYQALTGQLPFTGNPYQILQAKVRQDPLAARDVYEAVPEDLDVLCAELLRRDPAARPTGLHVLRRLSSSTSSLGIQSPDVRSRGVLLGRESHLQTLEDAFRSMQGGSTVVVQVSGCSGMGKTALLQGFLERLREQDEVVVLAGQCYEKEAVPYKAFDSLVDALASYLRRLAPLEAQALLPRDMAPLARVFPVLRDLPMAPARPGSTAIPDLQEVRRRAFAAFRELLARLGDRHLLVLAIDDLQWGDLDSLALYWDLLRPPDPPRLLFVGAFRSEKVHISPFLQRRRIRGWLPFVLSEMIARGILMKSRSLVSVVTVPAWMRSCGR
jgi:eukaryotic-like serine/threonine-protein kinase